LQFVRIVHILKEKKITKNDLAKEVTREEEKMPKEIRGMIREDGSK
jgi:hypothetical protein